MAVIPPGGRLFLPESSKREYPEVEDVAWKASAGGGAAADDVIWTISQRFLRKMEQSKRPKSKVFLFIALLLLVISFFLSFVNYF